MEIYVYREQNFHADPADKFIMGRLGLGVREVFPANMPETAAVEQLASRVTRQLDALIQAEVRGVANRAATAAASDKEVF